MRYPLLLTCGIICATVSSVAQTQLCVDPSFHVPFTGGVVHDIGFLPNGQIIVTGQLYGAWSSSRGNLRLNLNGSIDWSFGQQWGPQNGVLQFWGDDYFFSSSGQGVLRYFLSNGTKDNSYLLPDLFSGGSPTFYTFPDGRQWRGGMWSKRLYDDEGEFIGIQQGYGLIQRLPNGLVDPNFDHKFTMPGRINTISRSSDERMMLSSAKNTIYEGHAVGRILRVWPDGNLDTTFQTSIVGGIAGSYYFYPDGRILAFGYFHFNSLDEYPGDTLQIARLFPDGRTDTTWPAIDIRNSRYTTYTSLVGVGHLEIEPGKFLIVGDFDIVEGQSTGPIAVIDTEGNVLWDYFDGLDVGDLETLNSNYRYVSNAKMAPDGSVYLYGSFSGSDDACGSHSTNKLIVRLYPLDVGVRVEQHPEHFKLYPNPGGEHLQVQIGLTVPWEVYVRDGTGRVVLKGRGTCGSISLDSGILASGVYWVEVRTDDVNWSAKWIKQ